MSLSAVSIAPITRRVRVTPSDTVDLAPGCRALYVVSDGTVSCTLQGESTPLTHTLLWGAVMPWQVKRVYSTGTTATMEAWY